MTVTSTNNGHELHFSGNRKFAVEKQDITKVHSDFIVNAARPKLTGGGGVDKAIHRAAGSSLKSSCKKFPKVKKGMRCSVSQCRMTQSGHLPSRVVIHTVGPNVRKFYKGNNGFKYAKKALYDTYSTVLSEANNFAKHLATKGRKKSYSHWPMDLSKKHAKVIEQHAKAHTCTLTLPSISTGSYSFPKEKACQIATKAISHFFNKTSQNPYIKSVYLTVPGKSNSANFQLYGKRFNHIKQHGLQAGLKVAHPR